MPKPMMIGVSTASSAGVVSSRSAAVVQMSITLPWSGWSIPSMIFFSRNWRRTSSTTVPAVRPTARMARAEKRNAIEPPTSRPMNVSGLATLIAVRGSWKSAEPTLSIPSSVPIVSMYDENRATAAITAEPIAKPLVTALVVFPTASRLTMMRSASPSNSPDISAIPAALSATGPKVSSDTTTPVVASMPIPESAIR